MRTPLFGTETYRFELRDKDWAAGCFPANEGHVTRALQDVEQFLTKTGTLPDLVVDATIVMAEVLNNVEEHAYRGKCGQCIAFEVRRARGALHCTVEDLGCPLPLDSMAGEIMPKNDPISPTSLPEGGFGWPLVRRLTRDLVYRRDGNLNRLSFVLPAKKATAGE